MKDKRLFDAELFLAIVDTSKKSMISACKGMRKKEFFNHVIVDNFRKVMNMEYPIDLFKERCTFIDWAVSHFKLNEESVYKMAMLKIKIAPSGYKEIKDMFDMAEKICPANLHQSFLLTKVNWASSTKDVKLTREMLEEFRDKMLES